jgi:hypothetical protein
LKFISQIAEQNSECGRVGKRRYGFGLANFAIFRLLRSTKPGRFKLVIQQAVSLVKRLDFATFPGATHRMRIGLALGLSGNRIHAKIMLKMQ